MVDHVKETDKKADVDSPKVSDNVATQARDGIDDLTKKATEYYKQRRQGLTDSVTGKMVADGALPAKPEFYDSEAKEAPTKGDAKGAAPKEDEKPTPKQFADDFEKAQKTGDYSKVIEDYNKMTATGNTDQTGKDINAELHKRGLLPENLSINTNYSAALLGKGDVPGISIYNTETKQHSVYDANGKEMSEKDAGVTGGTGLKDDIKSEIQQERIKDASEYATKHFDEIDQRGDGHISRKDIDKYIEEKGSAISEADKKDLEYMRDHMKEVRNTVDDKGLDARGATKEDLQEYNKEKGREAPEKPPEPPKKEIVQRTAPDILDKREVGIKDPFQDAKEVEVQVKPGDSLDKFAEAAIKRAKGADYKPDEYEIGKQVKAIRDANPGVKLPVGEGGKLTIKKPEDIVIPIPKE